MTPDELLSEYRKLKIIGNSPDWIDNLLLGFKPSKHERHAQQFDRLIRLCNLHQDTLYTLIFSGQVTDERELYDLIFFGKRHHGSMDKKDNWNWVAFVARVRSRSSELPESIQRHLDWLLKVHGW